MPTEVIMPQLGESVVEGTVTRWLKSVGDEVEELEPLLEVNTDKVDTEIPSPASGTVLEILVEEGDTVDAGTVLAWLGEPGEEVPAQAGDGDQATEAEVLAERESPAETTARAGAPSPADAKAPSRERETAPGRREDLGFISPVVARIAAEHDVDLTRVEGTGRDGRITKKDVLGYLETRDEEPAAPAWESPVEGDLFKPTELLFGKGAAEAPRETAAKPGEVIPHSPVRRSIAEHMVRSKDTAPHVTTVMEADLQQVVAHRQANRDAFSRDGARLTFTPYFVVASVAALKAHPIVNASWTEEGVAVHGPIHIGVATSLGEEGLIVPVIKNADELSLLGITRAVNDLSERARAKKLKTEEVQGGTFTITNHGTSGSLFATPIINQPQSAILGVGVIQKRPVVIDDAIAIRPMVYVSLTFDHRVLDGAIADYFLASVVEALEGWPVE